MITCGIIHPDVTEQLPASHAASTHAQHPGGAYASASSSATSFQHDARYIIDVTPPSMSSTSSSDGSESPITIDHDRPFTYYNENFT